MRHLKSGRKLKRTASHRRALLCNLATSLIRSEQKMITTTLAKAKALRPFVERLITKARRAYHLERSGALPPGHKAIHYRRLVARYIRDEAVLQELFEVVAPVVAERNGGYTRIVKLGYRRGDGAQEAIIQLVDWGAPQDGATTSKRKRRAQPKQQPPAQTQPAAESASPSPSSEPATAQTAAEQEGATESPAVTAATEPASQETSSPEAPATAESRE